MRVAWPAGTSGITAGAALLPPVAAPAGLRQRRRSLRVTAEGQVEVPARFPASDWRRKARAIQPGSNYPAGQHCSQCGLCDTYYIAHVKDACAFLGDGMSRISQLEEQVHGRQRDLGSEDEMRFGVQQEVIYARNKPPVEGAQWTGIVTQIAIEMLESGKVDAVVCVQSDENDRFTPKPVVARSKADILAARGVKPTLSPNLSVLATVEALDVKKLLFIGVGCQVQALRSIEPYLGLEKLYVLGTNCTDNGPRKGLEKFLNAASLNPDTVLHYEFMQDYRVHLKHMDGSFEYVPYFCLPANKLNDVIAPSCYSCFDYPNATADLVIGYMGVPYQGTDMTSHMQYLTVRNERGRELLDSVRHRLEATPAMASGSRRAFVMQTVLADDEGKMGKAPDPAPRWLGNVLAWVLTRLGPKGLEFAKYSIDYHYIRNYIHVMRHWGPKRAQQHLPEFARRIVAEYDQKGETARPVPVRACASGDRPLIKVAAVLPRIKGAVAAGAAAALLVAAPPALAADLFVGEEIFNANCAACHTGGQNSVQLEKTLDKAALEQYLTGGFNIEAIETQVENGKGAMPAWGGRLSEEEIQGVAAYVFKQADGNLW
ncbi:7-hydroxymethyl chlorophyll a chloroplastic [Micractinium conductrix]|uniref:Cytochrome c-553 n=1 Tax=Micractinium conductrix TaxID=554055 RepID=A0A2P6VR10_9CHLO|nr:7-hydroxymethyl chlorophyll a chloroplastic [Micractinium conductrix]|eukprot:PSC76507.1 7-hydroxymethyl chlorophyll a chloroplastic [Micractinium conductrix]